MRAAAALVVLAACHAQPAPTTPPPSTFGFYLLAMMWSPACTDHLTLHGLWPNYTEDQAKGQPQAWPQFCGAYAHCDKAPDASCAPGAPVPADLATLAPAYVSGDLATHEWSKHGSCTVLSAADYFTAELAAIHSLPNNGTPDVLRKAAGHDLARADLQNAFGIPAASVVLGCDAQCRFTQVGFCIAKDAGEHPTTPTPCTPSVTNSDYDNGCVTRKCERVAIPGC